MQRMFIIILTCVCTFTFASAVMANTPGKKKLIVGTKASPPFSLRQEDGEWSGISIELWKTIAKELNIEYEFRELELQELFDGLNDGTLDVAVAALTITAEREREIDFTHSYYSTGLGIAVVGKQEKPILALFKRLFSFDFLKVIASLCLVILVFGFLLWLFERKHNPEQFGGKALHGIGAGFWWSAVTMTTVGYGDKAPVSFVGRFIGLIWMFMAIIILTTFTAAITTSLTVSQLNLAVSGPHDLPHVRVASLENSTSADYLHENQIKFSTYPDIDQALKALEAGRIDAFVYDAPILRYEIINLGISRLQVLPHTFQRQDYAIALAHGSEWREPLTQTMLEIISEPEWQRVLRRYLGSNLQ